MFLNKLLVVFVRFSVKGRVPLCIHIITCHFDLLTEKGGRERKEQREREKSFLAALQNWERKLFFHFLDDRIMAKQKNQKSEWILRSISLYSSQIVFDPRSILYAGKSTCCFFASDVFELISLLLNSHSAPKIRIHSNPAGLIYLNYHLLLSHITGMQERRRFY